MAGRNTGKMHGMCKSLLTDFLVLNTLQSETYEMPADHPEDFSSNRNGSPIALLRGDPGYLVGIHVLFTQWNGFRPEEQQTERMATFPTFKSSYPGTKTPAKRTGDWSRIFDPGMLDEYHFNRLLRLERKRSERSDKPFLLILLDITQLFQKDAGEAVLSNLTTTLGSRTRETDTVGWYKLGETIGILFTEFGNCEAEFAVEVIASKIENSVRESVGEELFPAISMEVHVFPEGTHNRKKHDGTQHEPEPKFYTEFAQPHKTRGVAGVLKRGIDIAGSLAAIALLSPVFLVIVLMVKLTSKGPVLFRQKRIGQYGRGFTFLKFRSMYVNCDSKIHQEYVTSFIAGRGNLQQKTEKGGTAFKLTNDPRITKVGRFLRRTSLDELPQFFNVLMGEMSLVGPRPPVPYEYERYGLWHRRRVMEVKPGITGLWQVMGRSKTSFDEMVRLDLKYARAWSVWLDLKILWLTPKAILSGDGAY